MGTFAFSHLGSNGIDHIRGRGHNNLGSCIGLCSRDIYLPLDEGVGSKVGNCILYDL